MTDLSLPSVTAEGNLARYFREIGRYPVLTPENEFALAKRWRDHGDVDAAQQLITSHLRLVAKLAMKYRGYGLPVADLMSEGNVGLMKAVRKFEPDLGYRLSTYAIWWIKAAITEYVLRSWSLVKMGTIAAQKKLFFSLRRLKAKMRIVDNGDLMPADAKKLAHALRISEDEVVAMNRRISARDASLNAPLMREDSTMEFQDTLVDDSPSPEALVAEREESDIRNRLLASAVADLPDRERHIFTERRLSDEPSTLEDLGRVYGVSRERVRQLEVRAYNKVKSRVEAAAAAA